MTGVPTGPKSPDGGPSIEELIAEERVPPAQPEAVRSRLLSRAHEAVRLGPPAPVAPSLVPAAGSRASIGIATAAVIVVGVTAAFLLARSEPSTPRAAVLAPSAALPSAAPPASVPSVDRASPAASTTSAPVREAVPVPSARSAASSRPAGGVEELTLLSRARQADARGDAAAVLAVVTEHERAYPRGRLAEEREVLRVKALVNLGRGEQARRAAARFRRQFPRSVLLPKVEEMLRSLP